MYIIIQDMTFEDGILDNFETIERKGTDINVHKMWQCRTIRRSKKVL